MKWALPALIAVSAWSVAICLLVGMLTIDTWIVDLVANLRVPLAAAGLAIAAALAAWQGRRSAGLLAAVAVLTAATEFRHAVESSPADQVLIELLSYNLNRGEEAMGDVLAALAEDPADVVFLQEVTPALGSALADLDGIYPYRLLRPRDDSFGIAMLSRYPLENPRVRFLPGGIPYLSTTIRIAGTELSLVGVHLEWPVTPSTYRLRNEQIDFLAEELAAIGGPAVVCGDFNLTPQSRFYREFQASTGFRGMPGSYRLNGSWPALLPALRLAIDHCFTSGALGVVGYSLGPRLGSDHRRLSVTVGRRVPDANRRAR